MVVDFRDDTLTAGGVTLVQSRYPFQKLPGGQSFDARDPQQQIYINKWWETAQVIANMNTIDGATSESNMLLYGVDNFSGGPAGRATGTNIASVARIGLSLEDGINFESLSVKPSQWGASDSTEWLCSDEIIGGTNSSGFARHNAVKGAFGFNGYVDCAAGEYLIAFIHIGHGSGLNGTVIPRYDMYIRYDHNVTGYGGSEGTVNECDGGGTPNSQDYAGGAHAKAYKSQTTSSTDNSYKSSSTIKAGSTQYIKWGGTDGGKDETDLLAQGSQNAWLFDNIYFPYNGPVRQGEPDSTGDNSNPNYLAICCDPTINPQVYNTPYCNNNYRLTGACDSTGGGDFGGGPGGGGPGLNDDISFDEK